MMIVPWSHWLVILRWVQYLECVLIAFTIQEEMHILVIGNLEIQRQRAVGISVDPELCHHMPAAL